MLAAPICPLAPGSMFVCVRRGGFTPSRSWAEVPLGVVTATPSLSVFWNAPVVVSPLGALAGPGAGRVMQPITLTFTGFPADDEVFTVRFTRIAPDPALAATCGNGRSDAQLLLDGGEVFSVARASRNVFRAVFLVSGTLLLAQLRRLRLRGLAVCRQQRNVRARRRGVERTRRAVLDVLPAPRRGRLLADPRQAWRRRSPAP